MDCNSPRSCNSNWHGPRNAPSENIIVNSYILAGVLLNVSILARGVLSLVGTSNSTPRQLGTIYGGVRPNSLVAPALSPSSLSRPPPSGPGSKAALIETVTPLIVNSRSGSSTPSLKVTVLA